MIVRLHVDEKVIHIQWKPYFKFRSFPANNAVQLSLMLGSGSEPKLPVSHQVTRVNNPIHLQSFCSSISVEYLINYMRYSTLYYKTGFVLDDFAQLYANVKCSEHV